MFTRTLRLRFNGTGASGSSTPPETPSGNTAPVIEPVTTPAAPAPAAPVDNGFPAGTPVAEMSQEQQTAYWRHYARTHETVSKQKDKELEAEREKNKTADEREADRLRAEGAAAASGPLLASAVEGQLRALTGRSEEDITSALEFIDTTRFLTDGALDKGKVAAYAATLGTVAATAPTPPGSAQHQYTAPLAPHAQPQPHQRTGGSIAEAQKAALEAMQARQPQPK
jgi:hypothetical protein